MIIPLILYGCLYFVTKSFGDIRIHWYITLSLDSSTVLSIYSKHLVLGFPVANLCPERIVIKKRNSSFALTVSTLLFTLYVFFEISYLRNVCFLLLIIIIAYFGIGRKQLILFICIGLISLFMGGDRFSIVIPILILMITFKLTYWQYFIYGSIFLISLIFVFTAIKENVPIIEFIQRNGIIYLWNHMQPIVLAAVHYDSLQLEMSKSFFEMIPFGKSLFEYSGSIQYARSLFASEGINGDFGSNSSINHLVVCLLFSCITFTLLKIKDHRLRVIFYIYFICLSPYFIRRDFANFINDCLILIILGVIIWSIYKMLPKQINNTEIGSGI